jgi:hypothetical protein
MRQVREILRLHFEAKLKDRQIAKICSVGKGTVRRYLKRLAAAHLSWPLPGDLDETTLEQRMFPPLPMAPEGRPLTDFNAVHNEGPSLSSVKSILASGLDRQPLPQLLVRPPVEHENIRGARGRIRLTEEGLATTKGDVIESPGCRIICWPCRRSPS